MFIFLSCLDSCSKCIWMRNIFPQVTEIIHLYWWSKVHKNEEYTWKSNVLWIRLTKRKYLLCKEMENCIFVHYLSNRSSWKILFFIWLGYRHCLNWKKIVCKIYLCTLIWICIFWKHVLLMFYVSSCYRNAKFSNLHGDCEINNF